MTPASFALAPRLDLSAVGEMKDQILARRGADLVLNTAQVVHFGGLALQVVRAAARTWSQDGHNLTIENPSPDLTDQLALFGYTAKSVTDWEPSL